MWEELILRKSRRALPLIHADNTGQERPPRRQGRFRSLTNWVYAVGAASLYPPVLTERKQNRPKLLHKAGKSMPCRNLVPSGSSLTSHRVHENEEARVRMKPGIFSCLASLVVVLSLMQPLSAQMDET